MEKQAKIVISKDPWISDLRLKFKEDTAGFWKKVSLMSNGQMVH